MNISTRLKENTDFIEKNMPSFDVGKIELTLGKKQGALFFVKDIVDVKAIGELILKPASRIENGDKDSIVNCFYCPEKTTYITLEKASTALSNGEAVLFIDGSDFCLAFGLKKFEQRSISEPPTSTVIKGPREGFVESLTVNVSMMRRKIKSPNLTFIECKVGKYSLTPVCVCYIKGIADQKLVDEIIKKIKSIKIDAILDSSYISKYLGEHKTSIFKQLGNTEKPDILSAKILEGRVAIFVDGSPIVLTVPYLLIEDFQSPSDYYASSATATLARFLRLTSVIISIYLPSVFVASELFHLQLLPLSFLLTIVNSIKGIPLSPSYEMFFTLLIFEILNEASIRMPKYVGMAVSIVGGLVLGETAVNAGIISAPALMIVAFSGICLFTVPELEKTFSVIRLLFLIASGAFGLYGVIVSSGLLLTYLVTFENYNAPLLAPYSPIVREDFKDGFTKGFLDEQKTRPKSLGNKNKTRLS